MFFHHCFLKMAKNGGRYVKSIYPPKNIPKTRMIPESGSTKGHLAQKHQIMVKKKNDAQILRHRSSTRVSYFRRLRIGSKIYGNSKLNSQS